MTKAETTAEGFVAVLKALPKSEQDAVILRIAQDEEFGHDLLDLAIVAERKAEPGRPFTEYTGETIAIPVAEWDQMLEDLKALDDIRAYDNATSERGGREFSSCRLIFGEKTGSENNHCME